MKTIVVLSVVAVGLQQLDVLLDSLNAWVELGIKVAGLAAAAGGAWRWLIGPGYRRVRGAVTWTGGQLELIGELGDRLEKIEARLDEGHEHFERIDATMEVIRSEYTQETKAALRHGRPVRTTPDGGIERRGRESVRGDGDDLSV